MIPCVFTPTRWTSQHRPARARAAALAGEAGLSLSEITERSRRTRLVKARRAVWIALRAEGFTFPEIAEAFGMHHSTIVHGCKQAGGAA